MKRRGVTVLVGSVLLILLGVQIATVDVPYVGLGPGPTYDILGSADGKQVLTLTGAQRTPSKGQLRMVTVSVHSQMTLLDAMVGWWQDDLAVVPRELVYPPNMTEEQVDAANAKEFAESQSSAETAAYRELGYPTEVVVKSVNTGSPADGLLKAGDVVQSVNGTPVRAPADLTGAVQAAPVGQQHTIAVLRGSDTQSVTVVTRADKDGKPRLGIEIMERHKHDFTLKFELDKIGGPSAGMMFALSIIDVLRSEDLTGGHVIVGTGTIDDDGKVGPIGGIRQKLVAAKRKKAEIFLTPADNCAEAMEAAQPGMPLVKVATLREALDALAALREKRPLPLCGK